MAKEAGPLMRLAQDRSLGERVSSVAGVPRQAVVGAHGSRVGCCLRLLFPSAAVFAAVRRSLRPLVTAHGERKGGQVEGPELEAGYPTIAWKPLRRNTHLLQAPMWRTHGANEGSSTGQRTKDPLVRNTRMGPRDSRPPPT